MYPVSDAFLYALRFSHAVEVKVSAYLGGVLVAGAENLAVLDGSIRVDSRATVRRSLEGLKAVATDGNAAALRALLSEPGTELQVWRGIRYGNGRTEFAPVGRFLVNDVEEDLNEPGAVVVNAPDISKRVEDARFLVPRGATAGALVVDEITDLLSEASPLSAVTDLSGRLDRVPSGIVWERERREAVDELATAIGCVVYADPTGDFVIEPVNSYATPARWIVNYGEGGTLLGGSRASSREGVYNVVVASSSPTDGSAPVYGIAEDNDPTSATYIAGPFGLVPRFYSSPLLSTSEQCAAAALTILRKSLGRRSTVAFSTIVNPALEGGDRVDLLFPDGTCEAHIVDSFTLPLSPTAPMTADTRAPEAAA